MKASLVAFLCLFSVGVAFAAAQPLVEEERVYIVTLSDSIEHPGVVGKAQVERLGGRLGFVYRYGPIGYSATLSESAVQALGRDPRVKSIVPNTRAEADAQTPSTGIKRIFAFENEALQIDEENNHWVNADVAVIDAGFAKQEDLNITGSVYCKEAGGVAKCKEEETPDRDDGHGTAVASVLGAIDNAEGVVGVAPGVRLWSVKVLENTGTSQAKVIAAINWVTENAEKIEVANMSIGCASPGSCEAEGVEAAISAAVSAGVVFVTSAGNFNLDVSFNGFGRNPYAITVSGIADYDGKPGGEAASLWVPSCQATEQPKDSGKRGEDDDRYIVSNYGEGIDIAAPAVCIRALWKGGGLTYKTGTSYAAPEVAGAAAILAEHENPEDIEDVVGIRNTIVEEGNEEWTDTSGDGIQEPLLDLSDEGTFY